MEEHMNTHTHTSSIHIHCQGMGSVSGEAVDASEGLVLEKTGWGTPRDDVETGNWWSSTRCFSFVYTLYV